MVHDDERPNVDPAPPKGPNPIIEGLENMTPEEAAVLDRLDEIDRQYGDDVEREVEDFKRAHDGMTPGEWLRRRGAGPACELANARSLGPRVGRET